MEIEVFGVVLEPEHIFDNGVRYEMVCACCGPRTAEVSRGRYEHRGRKTIVREAYNVVPAFCIYAEV